MGIGQNKFSQWVSGRNLPDVVVMLQAKRKYGLSLDWLYGDDLSAYKPDLADKLDRVSVKGSVRPFRKAG